MFKTVTPTRIVLLFLGHSVYHEMSCGWHPGVQLVVVHWSSVCECGMGEIFARSSWGYTKWSVLVSRDFDVWSHGFPDLVVRTPQSAVSFLVEVKVWNVIQSHTCQSRISVTQILKMWVSERERQRDRTEDKWFRPMLLYLSLLIVFQTCS
jgi:hypothetical protein